MSSLIVADAFFATAPKGVEPLLAAELEALGVASVRPGRGGVSFRGTVEDAYRACLWSRTANRILLPLATFPALDPESLYVGARAVPWEEHLAVEGTLAVEFVETGSQITHTQFGMQRVKDAIVDRFRDREGRRPSVDRERPDLRVYCYVLNDVATVSVDLSGESLHRRGYREEPVLAPLKENLAAALLLKAGWPEVAAAGGALVDPMCGSGTLPIEAALMAADIAPGWLREKWGFSGWLQHDRDAWARLLAEARERREAGARSLPRIAGYDRDARAVRAALANARRAGLRGPLSFERREIAHLEAPNDAAPGLLITNPPYGERLGEIEELGPLYAQFGDALKERFRGWKAAVITGNPELGKRMGLRARRVNAFYNGAIACKLLSFHVEPGWFVNREAADARARSAAAHVTHAEPSADFANRLRKNLRTLGRWAAREGVSCYRLYDADIPEYAVAVDLYEQWAHVQEYEAPTSIDPEHAQERLARVVATLPAVLGIPAGQIFLKVRRRQKGPSQYEKLAHQSHFHEVHEGPCRFLANFSDYLDTGLFLDHRTTRAWIAELARGRRFLNLFGYTGTATVAAALGGSTATTTVDNSPTYLAWAERNLALNAIRGPSHELVRADCLDWIVRRRAGERRRYDLIFLDPPTFSNSKRMEGTLDIQRDHVDLIRNAVRLLEDRGILIFSTNDRRFRLDEGSLAGLEIEDVTRRTLPRDFERNPRIHHCWRITRA